MVSKRWNTIRWGSNTALNPAVRRFIETIDPPLESFDSTLNAFDTAVKPFDSSDEPLDAAFDPALNRIVQTVNKAFIIITQS